MVTQGFLRTGSSRKQSPTRGLWPVGPNRGCGRQQDTCVGRAGTSPAWPLASRPRLRGPQGVGLGPGGALVCLSKQPHLPSGACLELLGFSVCARGCGLLWSQGQEVALKGPLWRAEEQVPNPKERGSLPPRSGSHRPSPREHPCPRPPGAQGRTSPSLMPTAPCSSLKPHQPSCLSCLHAQGTHFHPRPRSTTSHAVPNPEPFSRALKTPDRKGGRAGPAFGDMLTALSPWGASGTAFMSSPALMLPDGILRYSCLKQFTFLKFLF